MRPTAFNVIMFVIVYALVIIGMIALAYMILTGSA
jgi:hypothetical protein